MEVELMDLEEHRRRLEDLGGEYRRPMARPRRTMNARGT
jgi:hypothetical protein